MIDPSKITNYNLTVPELEEHLLWWVCAAGKNGTTASRLLDKLLSLLKAQFLYLTESMTTPFGLLEAYIEVDNQNEDPDHLYLADLLKVCGIGCYTHKAKTMFELVYSGLNLRTCTAEDLEEIYGIGMKTSRCFILHSREGAQYAGLDTHLLKFLRARGYDTPKSTPSSKKKYLELEKIFLEIAKNENKLPADLDLEIWNAYSIK